MPDYDYHRNQHSLSGPQAVVPLVLGKHPDVRSFLDVGCGTGCWGRALLDNGVTDYLGIDGTDHPDTAIHIPPRNFLRHDLTTPLRLERRFDAVLCLEVAEHLPVDFAESLVESLTMHADLVFFSAAAPGQRGQHHVNCRFPDYWQELFNGFGFECDDSLRWEIWDDLRVEPWYRQNLFEARRRLGSAGKESRIRSVRHPDLDSFIRLSGSRFQNLPRRKEQERLPAAKVPGRVVFFQNGLHGKGGHWLTETTAWRREVLSRGMEWTGFTHVLFGKQALGLGMIPAVPFLPGQSRRGFSKEARLSAYLDGATLLPEILDRHWPGDVGSDDLLYVAYATDVEMVGIARWLEGIPEVKRPMVAFSFYHLAHEWSVDYRHSGVRGDFHRYRCAVKKIQELNLQCRFFAAGDLLAMAYSSILQRPVEEMHFVCDCPSVISRDASPQENDVGILGGGREEQGRKLWPGILGELKGRKSSLRVCIQTSGGGKDNSPKDLEAFKGMQGMTFFTGISDYREHLRRISSCQLILLPYSPSAYAMRSSGVFQEACILGVPTVVPSKTPMGRMILKGRASGIVYARNDPSSIASAVMEALDRSDELREQALALREEWKRETSASSLLERVCRSFQADPGIRPGNALTS